MKTLVRVTNQNYQDLFKVSLTEEQLSNLVQTSKVNIDNLKEISFSDFEDFNVREIESFDDLTIGLKQDWFDLLFQEYFDVKENNWKVDLFTEDFEFDVLEDFILNQVKELYFDLFEKEQKAFLDSLEYYEKLEFYLQDKEKRFNQGSNTYEESEELYRSIQESKDEIKGARQDFLHELCCEKIEDMKEIIPSIIPSVRFENHEYPTSFVEGESDTKADAQLICIFTGDDLEQFEPELNKKGIYILDWDLNYSDTEISFIAYSCVSL